MSVYEAGWGLVRAAEAIAPTILSNSDPSFSSPRTTPLLTLQFHGPAHESDPRLVIPQQAGAGENGRGINEGCSRDDDFPIKGKINFIRFFIDNLSPPRYVVISPAGRELTSQRNASGSSRSPLNPVSIVAGPYPTADLHENGRKPVLIDMACNQYRPPLA